MSQITLIRHGQANTGARDEHSYDQLSDLGHQQAAWLGQHFENIGEHYTRVYSGTMQRHLETAQSFGAQRYADIQRDSRLNEFPYFALAQAMERQFGLSVPQTREGFAEHIPQVLSAWANNDLENIPETHAMFSERVQSALEDIAAGDGPAIVFTSGGLISKVMRQTLDLDTEGWSMMCLAIMNTSVHRLHRLSGKPLLTQFNAVPHLEMPDRHFAQTHL